MAADMWKTAMKKFLKPKPVDVGGPDDSLAAGAFASSQLSPTLKKSATSRWKRGKKTAEVKPQFDLASALPATDDFRTSLIMPNLSARFSMLREQDDPNSLLGKAMDDSVLQPRRKSRMMDYGFGRTGLSDIAEVSSLRGSIRPPFAEERQNSLASEDGDSEADGQSSVMSRSRPGEGNTLFGGRQKIYKIPTGGTHSTKSLGKAVYEDDVGMSAFQKHRQREREMSEARNVDDGHGFDFGLNHSIGGAENYAGYESMNPYDSAKDLSHSPSLSSYDKTRSTTSSSARSEARSSTAATSVASQPTTSNAPSPAPGQHASHTPSPMTTAPHGTLERSNTKTRRLYEQGLEQNMYEQQTSALSRLNSLHRQRGPNGKPSPPVLHGTRSTGNLHERNVPERYALRAQSPTLTSQLPPLVTFGSVRKPGSNTASPLPSNPQSPLETNDEFNNPLLNQSIEPADRGKATAMGAFNKPKQAFDEDQYLERQKQLQRSTSNAAARNRPTGSSALQSRLDQDRQHSDSSASLRDRSQSGPWKPEPSKAYNVFQNAASQISSKYTPSPAVQPPNRAPLPDTHRTFFGNISASESEDEEEETHSYHQPDYGYGMHHGKWQPTILPSVSEHPALRSQRSRATLAEEDEELEPKPLRPVASAKQLRNDGPRPTVVDRDAASPTLGQPAQPLNGMIHHLRQKSNQSSIYPTEELAPQDDIPELPEVPWNRTKTDSFTRVLNGAMDSDSKHESAYNGSNPWDLDEDSAVGGRSVSRASISPIESGPRSGSRLNYPSERQSEVSLLPMGSAPPSRLQHYDDIGPTAPAPQDAEMISWQQELKKQHTRDASTATQQERDAFASELAARRQAIQENMKSIVERQERSRENSPAPGSSGAFRTFGMLKAKSSRESMANMRDVPAKALKMLGATPTASQTSMHLQYERGGYASEQARPRGNSSPRPPPFPSAQHPAFANAHAEALPTWDARPRGDSGSERAPPQHPGERTLASAVTSRARSRSNSAATTGRSRSRTGPYRDDLDKAMMEGVGSSAAGHPELSPMVPRELTPRPSPDCGGPQFGIPTDESVGSKSNMTNYFEAKATNTLNTSQPVLNGRLTPAGSSPVTFSSNVFTSARAAPLVSPYSQNTTPPLSGASTPVMNSVSPVLPGTSSSRPNGLLRKKTISKSDISEPTLISSTSNIDTVDLPEGASLRNGMEPAPPIPPINPRRRGGRSFFGLGRSDSNEDSNHRAKSSDPFSPSSGHGTFPPNHATRMAAAQVAERAPSPAMGQYGYGPSASPERLPRTSPPRHGVGLDGGMF